MDTTARKANLVGVGDDRLQRLASGLRIGTKQWSLARRGAAGQPTLDESRRRR